MTAGTRRSLIRGMTIGAASTLVVGTLAFAVLGATQTDALSRPEASNKPALATALSAESPAASKTDTTAVAAALVRPQPKKTSAGNKPAEPGPSIDAYKGLGTWVDIYDKKVFDHPEAEVAKMAERRVRTIYVETSNSKQSYDIYRPGAQSRLIEAAHARGMKVVAWYLPSFESTKKDFGRIKKAIEFKTEKGERFDSFALDIESPAVRSAKERSKRMLALSKDIRRLTGPDYPLGAIIPSPYGLEHGSSWKGFPYKQVDGIYDVLLPMTYYTFHFKGGGKVHDNMVDNVRILKKKGTHKPIHLIGGLGEDTNGAEVKAFVKAARETKTAGASIYDWMTTSGGQWRELKAVKP